MADVVEDRLDGREMPASDGRAVDPSRFGVQELTRRQIVDWVAEHVFVEVCPEDCPNGKCWSLLQWVRSSQSNKATFWGTMYRGGMAKDEGAGGRFRDDGRSDLRMIEEIRKLGPGFDAHGVDVTEGD